MNRSVAELERADTDSDWNVSNAFFINRNSMCKRFVSLAQNGSLCPFGQYQQHTFLIYGCFLILFC